ncbi:hypothetical protein CONLIGDRAFT_643968 [Coniochaeta ligniaria NRRL 30616]|uniref:Uncharacterized protein n=1 Tax=Coniochaeta ligniaria NRRL 30616 TaxID=1408157 RepID=A0A1J7JQA4_9PEZI|nr:hypothetical protein CONLIGDRAFT_643968 [Coniochaeta ligniaria NRRL 30616]
MSKFSSRSESSMEHDMRACRIAAEVILRKEAINEATDSVPVCDKTAMIRELARLKTHMQTNGINFEPPKWAHRFTKDTVPGPSAPALVPGSGPVAPATTSGPSAAPGRVAPAPASRPSAPALAPVSRRAGKRKATRDERDDDDGEDDEYQGKPKRAKQPRAPLVKTRGQKSRAAAAAAEEEQATEPHIKVEEEEDQNAEPLIKVEDENDD